MALTRLDQSELSDEVPRKEKMGKTRPPCPQEFKEEASVASREPVPGEDGERQG